MGPLGGRALGPHGRKLGHWTCAIKRVWRAQPFVSFFFLVAMRGAILLLYALLPWCTASLWVSVHFRHDALPHCGPMHFHHNALPHCGSMCFRHDALPHCGSKLIGQPTTEHMAQSKPFLSVNCASHIFDYDDSKPTCKQAKCVLALVSLLIEPPVPPRGGAYPVTSSHPNYPSQMFSPNASMSTVVSGPLRAR